MRKNNIRVGLWTYRIVIHLDILRPTRRLVEALHFVLSGLTYDACKTHTRAAV
jgi:hypothetical protein|tara:strand:+ start:112 stop:270 length:159 start_codon:yes stop_codon:yes gene_type:complete